MATRVTLEVVCNLVTDGWWSEEREDPKQVRVGERGLGEAEEDPE